MKPTPSKLVLLMSAAGLGLSWSGVALASRDSSAPAGSALTFGVALRSGQGCDSQSRDGWAACPVADGDLLRTIVAETASLPLPLPLPLQPTQPPSETKPSFRAFDAYAAAPAPHPAEVRAADDGPEPDHEASLPEAPATTAPTAEGSTRDREADAIAMVLLDDPQGIAGDAGKADTALAAAVPGEPREAREAPKALGDDGRSAHQAQAALSEQPTPEDSASVEHVLAGLAEVLGAQIDASPAEFEAPHAQIAAAPARDIAPQALAAPPATDPPQPVAAVPTSATGATSDDGHALERSSEADDIVVASHSDKILMSLAALRSGEASDSGRLGAQTKKSVVVRHTDKVLETLALFKSRTPKQAAFACTKAPAESADYWELSEPVAEAGIAGLAAQPDILLDLLPPVADGPGKPMRHAAPAQPTLPEPPVAGRRDRGAFGADLVALNADTLDEVRGGFVIDGGLKISFGIERAVYLNGNLVTTTSLNIADLAKISGGGVQLTSNDAGKLAVLQNGAGNFAPGAISSTAAGTFIQNTLDNQKIQTMTHINAVVNSAGIMRAINLQSSMQSAIVNSLRR